MINAQVNPTPPKWIYRKHKSVPPAISGTCKKKKIKEPSICNYKHKTHNDRIQDALWKYDS